MSDSISLYELLNVAIGTPRDGVVNFTALHSLLAAVLRHLDIADAKSGWRDSAPGHGPLTASGATEAAGQPQVHAEPDQGPGDQGEPSSPSPSPDGLLSRVQGCEDGLTQVMKLLEDLHKQKDDLKDEMKEQRHQLDSACEETVAAVEKCCLRVDALEEAVTSVQDAFQKYPDPEQLLSNTENLQKELVSLKAAAQGRAVKPTQASVPSSPRSSVRTASPTSPVNSGDLSTVLDAMDAQSVPSTLDTEQAAAGVALRLEPSESQPSISKLKENCDQLETRVAALEEVKVEQTELLHLREFIANAGSQSESNELMDQLNQQKALLDSLMSDWEKLEDATLSGSLKYKAEHDQSDREGLCRNEDRSAVQTLDRKLSCLFLLYERLQDQAADRKQSRASEEEEGKSKAELENDVQSATHHLRAECDKLHETIRRLHEDNSQRQSHIEELYKITEELEEKKADKQMVESEIKADKSVLESKVSRLQFDSTTEQLNSMFHELLSKVTGQEQDWHKVIDRLSTEMECKLNRIELDSVKKQLEDRWKRIHEKLQAQGAPEHDDAAGIRKQLVDRFHCLSCDRPVVKYTPGPHLVTLPSTPAFPSHKSIRPFTVYALEQFRQHYRSERIAELTDYSHLAMARSCGGSHTMTSSSQRRSGLQYGKHHSQPEADAMVQSEEVDIVGLDGHIYKGRLNPAAARNAETKLPTISTKEGMCKSKDKIRGSPPHKPPVSPEGRCSPLVLHGPSPRSAQCSRSVSSMSGRDWPVSALGCASQSSVTQTSAAGESNSDQLGL